MKKAIFYILVCFPFLMFTIIACTEKKQSNIMTDEAARMIKIPVPLASSVSFIDSVEYVLLEQDNANMLSCVSKICKTSDAYIIFDKYGSEKINVYGLDGQFRNSIGKKGKAANEYVMPWDIAVADKQVKIYDRATNRMLTFNINGQFVGSQKSEHIIEGFAPLANGNYLVALAKEDISTEIGIMDKKLRLIKSIKNFDTENHNDKVNDNIFQIADSTILYNNPVCYDIYEFDRLGNPRTTYSIDFWNNNAPDDLTYSYEKFIKDGGKKKYAYMYDTPLKVGNSFVFSLMSKGYKAGMIYNTVSQIAGMNTWKPMFKHTELILPLYAQDDVIYGWMDDSVLELISDKDELPDHVVRHLRNHGIIISIYQLKKTSIC